MMNKCFTGMYIQKLDLKHKATVVNKTRNMMFTPAKESEKVIQ